MTKSHRYRFCAADSEALCVFMHGTEQYLKSYAENSVVIGLPQYVQLPCLDGAAPYSAGRLNQPRQSRKIIRNSIAQWIAAKSQTCGCKRASAA